MDFRESKKFGGFPVGGQWLICQNKEVIKNIMQKYMEKQKLVHHQCLFLDSDTRVIDGKQSLLFGPFATFSTKFLNTDLIADLFKSVNLGNVGFLMNCGLNDISIN